MLHISSSELPPATQVLDVPCRLSKRHGSVNENSGGGSGEVWNKKRRANCTFPYSPPPSKVLQQCLPLPPPNHLSTLLLPSCGARLSSRPSLM